MLQFKINCHLILYTLIHSYTHPSTHQKKSNKATTETLREIYAIFHAEEQCHANAEIAQMKRWNILEDGTPKPNKNYARSLNGSTPMLMICLFIY